MLTAKHDLRPHISHDSSSHSSLHISICNGISCQARDGGRFFAKSLMDISSRGDKGTKCGNSTEVEFTSSLKALASSSRSKNLEETKTIVNNSPMS
ncbi:hypothetical protein PsorP6_016005 [Peronosclerospora sorghi]|uniref:Uncharacterized protein n=1 Tax=Peronosclerospora sorghi TaxID=230839 RepID=A0ACC0WNQ6_9STRA|nr:hypothetical protein PsorP6_016005 [Peronosclerospora sorghi]